MVFEELGRKRRCLTYGTLVPFTWRDSLKPLINPYSSQDSNQVLSTTKQNCYCLSQLRCLAPCSLVSCYKRFGRTFSLRHQGSTSEALAPLYQTTQHHVPEHCSCKAFCFTCRLLWPIDYLTFCGHVFMSTKIGKTRLSLVTALSDKLLIYKGEQMVVKKYTPSRSANKRSYLL